MDEVASLPSFAIAFQPIVDVSRQRIVAYEALTRSQGGIPYPQMTADMEPALLRRFHRQIASTAIHRAVELGIRARGTTLCLNLQPDLHPEALNAEVLLEAATHAGMPASEILVELTEDHKLSVFQLQELLASTQAAGFSTGMDDFGAGYSGLSMLVECRPHVLKLDRALVRGIDSSDTRQKIVASFTQLCASLDMALVAEGIETPEECAMLTRIGITLMQGFLFSRPVVDQLPWDNVGDAVWGTTPAPGQTLHSPWWMVESMSA